MTNQQSSEFVFSAPAYLCLISHGRLRDVPELRELNDAIITSGVLKAKAMLKQFDFPMMVSLLFNAFTEENYCEPIKRAGDYGFDRIYTDSGGLQIFSRGMSANKDVKQRVYKTQAKSDLTMCFDNIPVKNVRPAFKTSYIDRVFMYDQFQSCALDTCNNVIEQINAFRELNTSTKIFFVVQGNNFDDMCEWFDIAVKNIPKDYWDHIGGLAIGRSLFRYGAKRRY